MHTLLVDDRERAIFGHLDGKCTYQVKRLKIGDYAVVRAADGQLVAVFERKTLEDYGASLKDGRIDNREKLFLARDKTQCRIFYIIEGWSAKSRASSHAGIPFKSIEASIFHQMMRDGIYFIFTSGIEDTAQALGNFVASLETIKPLPVKKAPPAQVQAPVPTPALPGPVKVPEIAPKPENIDVLEDGTALVMGGGPPRDFKYYVSKIWEVIPTVGPVNGKQIAETGLFTVRDWLSGNIRAEQLDAVKFPSGRGLSAPIRDRLLNKEITYDIAMSLLAAIPLISQKSAHEICKVYWPLVNIFADTPDNVAKMKLGATNKPLGLKKAKNIFNYLSGPAAEQVPKPPQNS